MAWGADLGAARTTPPGHALPRVRPHVSYHADRWRRLRQAALRASHAGDYARAARATALEARAWAAMPEAERLAAHERLAGMALRPDPQLRLL